eukprot:m.169174 g.169174  ORF g.169174 m.169174 type:complete len:57 (-) comp14765_c1_seq1:297-467(-)
MLRGVEFNLQVQAAFVLQANIDFSSHFSHKLYGLDSNKCRDDSLVVHSTSIVDRAR